eukprot:TRINITY_DN3800_c0_g4_i1.p1 TRINITY_DN3800_c0_g4~~TRINITY_DN3800_c0_g4_i1.p1  ORF type:complete len:356 (-),score=70.43 TRINITY_DN3800_c0_g4_i1:495-1562(-)
MNMSVFMKDLLSSISEERSEHKFNGQCTHISSFFMSPIGFKHFLKMLVKSVRARDTHTVSNIVKSLGAFRRHFTVKDAEELIAYLISDFPASAEMCREIEDKHKIAMQRFKHYAKYPEVQAVVHLIYIMKLADEKKYREMQRHVSGLIGCMTGFNKRTLDPINSRLYYFHALAYELLERLQYHREEFFSAYRVACLRLDQFTQAVILNVLIRSYIIVNEYESAHSLVAKTKFPDGAPNSQLAKYLYYGGRIKAVQLEYSEAEKRLTQALHKAPQRKAKGFRVEVMKLLVVVKLLTGSVPERSVFSQNDLCRDLYPYLLIAQSVRAGNFKLFFETLASYSTIFLSDHNYNLILRYS